MTQIKLSQQTLSVLRNYATINSSIVIRQGNQLKTISIGENAIASFVCEEEFPQDFAIYDLTKFLSGISLFSDPILKFSSQDGQIVLTLCDKEDETSNTYSQVVDGETTGDYEMFMKVENIRLVPGEYNVKISKQLITEWKHSTLDLTYYIALEP